MNQKHFSNSKFQIMSLAILNWLMQEPEHDDVAPAPEGGLHIPIERLEDILDKVNWSTQNFHWHIFKNGYADNVIAASIELVLEYEEEGKDIKRIFVGGCNFSINAILPNHHYIATAKSLCVKNAASAAGRRLGRWLNPATEVEPDEKNKELANEGIKLMNSLDEIKPEHHVKEVKDIKDKNSKR